MTYERWYYQVRVIACFTVRVKNILKAVNFIAEEEIDLIIQHAGFVSLGQLVLTVITDAALNI